MAGGHKEALKSFENAEKIVNHVYFSVEITLCIHICFVLNVLKTFRKVLYLVNFSMTSELHKAISFEVS